MSRSPGRASQRRRSSARRRYSRSIRRCRACSIWRLRTHLGCALMLGDLHSRSVHSICEKVEPPSHELPDPTGPVFVRAATFCTCTRKAASGERVGAQTRAVRRVRSGDFSAGAWAWGTGATRADSPVSAPTVLESDVFQRTGRQRRERQERHFDCRRSRFRSRGSGLRCSLSNLMRLSSLERGLRLRGKGAGRGAECGRERRQRGRPRARPVERPGAAGEHEHAEQGEGNSHTNIARGACAQHGIGRGRACREGGRRRVGGASLGVRRRVGGSAAPSTRSRRRLNPPLDRHRTRHGLHDRQRSWRRARRSLAAGAAAA